MVQQVSFLLQAHLALRSNLALFPWPIAASRLAAVGPGPYVPLTYTSLSSDTRTYQSQICLILSRLPERWRLYRVSETNGVVRVEELSPRAAP